MTGLSNLYKQDSEGLDTENRHPLLKLRGAGLEGWGINFILAM